MGPRQLWRASLVLALGAAAAAAVLFPQAVGAAQGNAAQENTAPGRHAAHVCSIPTGDNAACDALVIADNIGRPLLARGPSGLSPTDIRSAYALGSTTSGGRTVAIVDAYNDSDRRGRPREIPLQFGLPACTTANGCLRRSARPARRALPAQQRRLGAGDQPRPRHGLRDLPGLPHPARRGQLLVLRRPRCRRQLRRHPERHCDQQQLQRQRHRSACGLQPPWHRGHRVDRRQRLRRRVAGDVRLGRRRRRNQPEQGEQRSRLDRDRVERCRAAAARQRTRNRPGRRQRPSAPARVVADVSALPTRTPECRSTTRRRTKVGSAGRSTAAPAPRRRSSPACTRCPATQPAIPPTYTWAHSSALNDVTTGSNGNCSTAVWCTPAPVGTVRPASARRTAPAASSPASYCWPGLSSMKRAVVSASSSPAAFLSRADAQRFRPSILSRRPSTSSSSPIGVIRR